MAIEKEISKIVMEKQDPVELEAVMRKFFLVLIGNMEFKSALVFH